MKNINLRKDAAQQAEAAKTIRLNSFDFRSEMKKLESVYKLPKDYQYDAARAFGLLAWYKYNHNGLSYADDSLASNEVFRSEFIDHVAWQIAYKQTDWGRKKNTYKGNRTLNFPETIRTESCVRGRWTSYDYYSDYSVFFHRKRPEAIYSFGNRAFHMNFASPDAPAKIGNLLHITAHPLFSEAINSGQMRWDKKEVAFVQLSEEYHIKHSQLYVTEEEGTELFETVRKRFEAWNGSGEKLAEKIKLQSILDNPPAELTVCVAHSLAAGNCEVGTAQFRRKYGLTENECYTVEELKAKKVPFGDKMFQRALVEAIKAQQ